MKIAGIDLNNTLLLFSNDIDGSLQASYAGSNQNRSSAYVSVGKKILSDQSDLDIDIDVRILTYWSCRPAWEDFFGPFTEESTYLSGNNNYLLFRPHHGFGYTQILEDYPYQGSRIGCTILRFYYHNVIVEASFYGFIERGYIEVFVDHLSDIVTNENLYVDMEDSGLFPNIILFEGEKSVFEGTQDSAEWTAEIYDPVSGATIAKDQLFEFSEEVYINIPVNIGLPQDAECEGFEYGYTSKNIECSLLVPFLNYGHVVRCDISNESSVLEVVNRRALLARKEFLYEIVLSETDKEDYLYHLSLTDNDQDRGHGNDDDRHDDDNPGRGNGHDDRDNDHQGDDRGRNDNNDRHDVPGWRDERDDNDHRDEDNSRRGRENGS
ncbi:MAG: hypothetical protein NUW37_08680 [Planctomycetes bacterium]|nr:hypothetical protein [Planctomycetota bacterium]